MRQTLRERRRRRREESGELPEDVPEDAFGAGDEQAHALQERQSARDAEHRALVRALRAARIVRPDRGRGGRSSRRALAIPTPSLCIVIYSSD